MRRGRRLRSGLLGSCDQYDTEPSTVFSMVFALFVGIFLLIVVEMNVPARRPPEGAESWSSAAAELRRVSREWRQAQEQQEELRVERRNRLHDFLSQSAQQRSALQEASGEGEGVPTVFWKGTYYARQAAQASCSPDDGEELRCRRAMARVPWVLPRIFVYPLPGRFHRDITKKYRRCVTDQYGTETFIHEALLKSEFVTPNPEEADLFFVPVYGECFLWSWEMLRHAPQEVAFGHTAQLYKDALAIVQQEHGWWNRSGGRDHVWVFPGARGPTIFRGWRERIASSIFLTPEGDRTLPYFNTWKDVVIPGLEAAPEFTRPSSRDQLLQLEGRPRKHLAHFRGTIHHSAGWAYSQGLRPRLQALFANHSDIIFDTKHSDCDRHCYRQEMIDSDFCLDPLGWSPWTLRFFQAIMVRCIPVMIADNIEFPYESSINYSRFVLKVPQHSVDNIVSIMRDMPPAERARRRREMDKVWLMFTWQNPPIPGDAFYSLMQQLAMKTRASRNGPLAFWPRNGPSA